MDESTHSWKPALAEILLLRNATARVELDGHAYALYNLDGALYCTDDRCTHQEASLADGDLDTRRCAIECPLHGSAFELATGNVLSLPATEPVATYPVRVVDGTIEVAVHGS